MESFPLSVMDTGRLTPRDTWITILVLIGLGIVITFTNPWFTFMDDEIAIVQGATNPIQQTVHAFTSGLGQHRHPPLYDLLLACWLRLSGARVALLRVPATLFYLLGLWSVIQAAGLIGGVGASRAALWIGVVFPYGFHFGRIAGWYSLSFCTVALLTYTYLRMEEKPGWGRWVLLVVACELALYTNYFLLALIGLVLLDYWIRHRRESAQHLAAAGATFVIILLGFYPLVRPFLVRLSASASVMRPAYSLLATVFFGGYNVYTLFVSESVAPWFWYFSLPALAAIAFCSCLILRYGPGPARRIFIGFLACMLVMTALNLINTKVALFLAPWLLISVAAMVGNLPRPSPQSIAVLALTLTGAIGWFGILSRHYYAAPRLIEPWQPVAEQAAGDVKKGAVVIGNNPSFFFYLTDAIRSPDGPGTSDFIGCYPVYLKQPQLFDTNQWLESGKVYGPTTLLVKGAADESFWGSTAATERVLNQTCQVEGVERQMPDTGFALKRRWFAGAQQPAWRIEVRTYRCPSGNETAAGLHN